MITPRAGDLRADFTFSYEGVQINLGTTQLEARASPARDSLLGALPMDIASLPDPTDILSGFRKHHPGHVETVLELHEANGAYGATWPQHCFVPTDLVANIFRFMRGYEDTEPPLEEEAVIQLEAGLATTLAAWSVRKMVYTLDDALFAELFNAPAPTTIPVEVLRRLPGWCVYVTLPHLRLGNDEVVGAFAYLDTDPHAGTEALRVHWDTGSQLVAFMLPIKGSVEDGMRELAEDFGALLERIDPEAVGGRANPQQLVSALGSPELVAGLVNVLIHLASHELSASTRPSLGMRGLTA